MQDNIFCDFYIEFLDGLEKLRTIIPNDFVFNLINFFSVIHCIQAQYETLPLAVVRREEETRLRKSEIELLMKQQKVAEMKKMIQMRDRIDDKLRNSLVVECVKLCKEIKIEEIKNRAVLSDRAKLEEELKQQCATVRSFEVIFRLTKFNWSTTFQWIIFTEISTFLWISWFWSVLVLYFSSSRTKKYSIGYRSTKEIFSDLIPHLWEFLFLDYSLKNAWIIVICSVLFILEFRLLWICRFHYPIDWSNSYFLRYQSWRKKRRSILRSSRRRLSKRVWEKYQYHPRRILRLKI